MRSTGGSLTLNELSSVSSIATSGLTGKSLTEMAMDLVTGKDCRIMESVMRDERKLCEERNSPATYDDFNGVLSLVRNDRPPLDVGVFIDTGGFEAAPSVMAVNATGTQAE